MPDTDPPSSPPPSSPPVPSAGAWGGPVAGARGLRLPKLGLGTFGMTGAACTDAVLGALDLGYRHIDTAQMYGNEAAVGDALARTGVARGDVHVTTKVWWDNLAPEAMRRACEESLRKLRLDRVDLFLIHWPAPDMDLRGSVEALCRLQADGLATHIGVSNFTVALLNQALALGAPIACDQVEYHVTLDQTRVLDAARAAGVAVTAYCPLARGNRAAMEGLAATARKHGATASQVALKWLLDQDGVAAIPKASQRANQQSNLDALKLVLDDEDRAAIARLPKSNRLVSPAFGPNWDAAA